MRTQLLFPLVLLLLTLTTATLTTLTTPPSASPSPTLELTNLTTNDTNTEVSKHNCWGVNCCNYYACGQNGCICSDGTKVRVLFGDLGSAVLVGGLLGIVGAGMVARG
ncbi:uncharacterized protein LY89DRAFT_670044 [Mollisia scopiformis]|uniref:Uncharacterized protein n=1 Tax=Mollisia scopiformis TaxID=149040 RepID=A0A194X8U6_MOLSC|nr:uncharacterized protein LY89DRAFT_670044 [Mollisia scopiformis]KUJ16539.1 hypothetical protein LY89DRAFT_670044 [Mollisia scopiformis]